MSGFFLVFYLSFVVTPLLPLEGAASFRCVVVADAAVVAAFVVAVPFSPPSQSVIPFIIIKEEEELKMSQRTCTRTESNPI